MSELTIALVSWSPGELLGRFNGFDRLSLSSKQIKAGRRLTPYLLSQVGFAGW